LLFTTAGKNAGFPKGIVLLVEVAHGDNGLGALAEGCNRIERVILKERNGQDVIEDEGDRPVKHAGFTWA
jgi:hypothetical protein